MSQMTMVVSKYTYTIPMEREQSPNSLSQNAKTESLLITEHMKGMFSHTISPEMNSVPSASDGIRGKTIWTNTSMSFIMERTSFVTFVEPSSALWVLTKHISLSNTREPILEVLQRNLERKHIFFQVEMDCRQTYTKLNHSVDSYGFLDSYG